MVGFGTDNGGMVYISRDELEKYKHFATVFLGAASYAILGLILAIIL